MVDRLALIAAVLLPLSAGPAWAGAQREGPLGRSLPAPLPTAYAPSAWAPGAPEAYRWELSRDLQILSSFAEAPVPPGPFAVAFVSDILKERVEPARQAARLAVLEALLAPAPKASASAWSSSEGFTRLRQRLADDPESLSRLAELKGQALAALLTPGADLPEAAASGAELFDGAKRAPAPEPLAVPADAGSLGARVLARSELRKVSLRTIGNALVEARDGRSAAVRLEGLGLLEPSEAAAAAGDATGLRYALLRVWHEAFPLISPPFTIERARGLSAVVVERDGVRFHLHGVFHGSGQPGLGGLAVRRLTRGLAARGAALFWEQALPGYYGGGYGTELLDGAGRGIKRAVIKDGLLATRPVQERPPLSRVSRAAFWVLTAGLPAAWAASSPASVWAWLALAAAAGLLWLAARSFLPLIRLRLSLIARDSARDGLEDLALHTGRYAALMRTATPDPRSVLRNDLPMPLKASFEEDAERSRLMAETVAAEARAKGLSEVHLLTGANHVGDMAWHLASTDGAAPTES